MAIYNIAKQELQSVYAKDGQSIDKAYDIFENVVFDKDTPDDPYILGRLLLFEDSFRDETLNSDNWQCEIGKTRGESRPGVFRAQNVLIEDGKLHLIAKRENHLQYTWTMGSITSGHIRAWMYGRFEAKIKMPGISGAFPAFWSIGGSGFNTPRNDDGTIDFERQFEGGNATLWPLCGEIDFTEGTPGNDTRPYCNIWDMDGNSMGAGRPSSPIVLTDWHIYSMEWTSEYIAMLLDGIEYKRYTFSDYSEAQISAYKNEPQCIILDLDVGGAGGTIPNDVNEMNMYVDWVRVYAPLGVSEEIPDTAINIPSTLRLQKGYFTWLVARFTPNTATNQFVIWESSDDNVVTVEHGCVRGINIGTATITAKSVNGNTAVCNVTVVNTL